IADPRQLLSHPLRGALFETWVVSELAKGRSNRGLVPNLYFWRDRHGLEVDCLLDQGTALSLVEVKSGKTVPADAFNAIRSLRELAGPKHDGEDWLVYGGERNERRSDVTVVSWQCIGELVTRV
ncbi:MAG: DUF4143 domain-containing protein, partial [Salinisphaera sp.]|nr:DUF4143 domain-containing protein [Salinisphaera sp.]